LILRFYKQRAERVEWFVNRDPHLSHLADLIELGVFLPLKVKDSENRQIVIIRTAAHNPTLHKQNDVFKVGMMILDILMAMDHSISVYGIRAIFGESLFAFSAPHNLSNCNNILIIVYRH
jgi:hypothetical protein